MKFFFLLLALLATVAQAQDSTPLVKSTTRVVLLDAVVTDKAGKPVRTLTQDDFTVLENGVPQKISSFESPLSVASSGPALPNTPRTVILLDELNIAYSDLSFARDKIIKFLEKNELQHFPTSLITIGLHGLSILQDYTQDEALLKEKLTQYKPALLNPVEGQFQQGKVQEHAQRSIDSLIEIARAATGSSYNLNVIWVTGGFAGALKETKSADGHDNGIRRLANVLMTARMRLYTIDPSGATNLQANIVATPAEDKLTVSNTTIDTRNNDDLTTQGKGFEANQLMTILTGMMGGRAYYGRNDVDVLLSQAVADGAANYSLSYSPSNSDFKGDYRKIEIRSRVEGTTARTRLGYYAEPDEAAPSEEVRTAKWKAALASPLTYSAFNMSCPLRYDGSTGHASGTLTVKPTPLIMESPQQTVQIILFASLSKTGDILSSRSWQVDRKNTWTNRVTSASLNEVIPKKAHRVRVLVSDPASEHIGTCDYIIP